MTIYLRSPWQRAVPDSDHHPSLRGIWAWQDEVSARYRHQTRPRRYDLVREQLRVQCTRRAAVQSWRVTLSMQFRLTLWFSRVITVRRWIEAGLDKGRITERELRTICENMLVSSGGGHGRSVNQGQCTECYLMKREITIGAPIFSAGAMRMPS